MADYYIENISTKYPECNVVKDPFVHKAADYAGFHEITRWWNSDCRKYRLAFFHSASPNASILFSQNANKEPFQIEFARSESVTAKLEALSMSGYVIFISDSYWKCNNVIWPPYRTKEQAEIRIDLGE